MHITRKENKMVVAVKKTSEPSENMEDRNVQSHKR